MLRYWHPVLASRHLPRNRVVAVKVAGHSIALFRKGDGQLGAVADQSAHRRMKLSLGRVEQKRLICPYHGWSFTSEGTGDKLQLKNAGMPSELRMRGSIGSDLDQSGRE